MLTREEEQRPSSLSLPLPMGDPSLLQKELAGGESWEHASIRQSWLCQPRASAPQPILWPTTHTQAPFHHWPAKESKEIETGWWAWWSWEGGGNSGRLHRKTTGPPSHQTVYQGPILSALGLQGHPGDTATGPWWLALHVTLSRGWGIPATRALGSHFKSKRGTPTGSQSILSRAEQAPGHPLPWFFSGRIQREGRSTHLSFPLCVRAKLPLASMERSWQARLLPSAVCTPSPAWPNSGTKRQEVRQTWVRISAPPLPSFVTQYSLSCSSSSSSHTVYISDILSSARSQALRHRSTERLRSPCWVTQLLRASTEALPMTTALSHSAARTAPRRGRANSQLQWGALEAPPSGRTPPPGHGGLTQGQRVGRRPEDRS